MADINVTRRRLRQMGRWRSFGYKMYGSLLVFLIVSCSITTILNMTILYGVMPDGLVASLNEGIDSVWRIEALPLCLFLTLTASTLPPLCYELVARLRLRQLGSALQDVRLVPDLLFVLQERQFGNKKFQDKISVQLLEALIQLLPQLTAEEATCITASQAIFLCKHLQHYESSPELAQAILRALPLFGAEEALPIVQRVSKLAKEVSVRQATRDCLPLLEQRIAALEQGRRQNLLRPSQAPTQPQAALLLRAAHYTAETHVEQLLRPNATESEQ